MFMPKTDRFTKDKTEMLNAYREINKEVAEQYNCPYIDMRQAFLDAIPSYRLNYKVLKTEFTMTIQFGCYFLHFIYFSLHVKHSYRTIPADCVFTLFTRYLI